METKVKFEDVRPDGLFKYQGEICSKTPVYIEEDCNEYYCNAQSKERGLLLGGHEEVLVSEEYQIDWRPIFNA
jgi:hypothetical protein